MPNDNLNQSRLASPNPTLMKVEHPRVSILDLPNELWHIIMEFVEAIELYALGRTSRHLNSLLREFLWHTRLSSPRSHDSNDQGGDPTKLALKANVVGRRSLLHSDETPDGVYLHIAKRNGAVDHLDLVSIVLNPPSIHELTCEFDVPHRVANRQVIVSSLSEDYSQLSRFISRLPPGLSHINIGLGPFDPNVYGATNEDVWLARTRVLNELFNTCIKTGCSTFRVRGGYYPADISVNFKPPHFRWSNLVDWVIPKKEHDDFIFSEKKTRLGKGWKIFMSKKAEGGLPPPSLMVADESTKTETKNEANPQALIPSRLTHFAIESCLLVVPPFSNWTYQVVATSPLLTTLTLSTLDYLGSSSLEVVFTWLLEAIKIQNVLRCLKIGSKYIHHLPPLFWFINELGRGKNETLFAPTPLEELDLGWCTHLSNDPARLHTTFDGVVRSQTLKCIKANWNILVRLVQVNGRRDYSEEEERVFELAKERFTALERIELNGVVRIVRST